MLHTWKLGSEECSRRFSSWEADRLEPPDDEDPVMYHLQAISIRTDSGRGSWTSGARRLEDGDHFATVFDLHKKVYGTWIGSTKRGQAFKAAALESLGLRPSNERILCSEDCSKNFCGEYYSPREGRNNYWFFWLRGQYARKAPCKWVTLPTYTQSTEWTVERFRYGSVRATIATSPELEDVD